jgi:lipoprotein NlpD
MNQQMSGKTASMVVSRSGITGFGFVGRVGMLGALGALVSIGVAGCSSALTPAPISEQSTGGSPTASTADTSGVVVSPVGTPTLSPAAPAPAGPGFYRVKPGDTLYGIARAQKQRPSDLIKWNSLPASLQVNIDQLLRVAPPGAPGTATSGDQWTQSAETKTAPPIIGGASSPAAPSIAASSGSTNATNEPPPQVSVKGTWLAWPAQGNIITKFGEGGSKGIDIGGKVGEPVKAAAAGRVVYAGTGLRAYGQMIIVKHSNDFLSAYAHNSKLLVKEGDTVRQGSVIAEMGTGQNDKPLLHFELRKSGQAVDPVPSLRKGG